MGNMTASFSDSLASSSPATSSHFTFGFSITIAPEIESVLAVMSVCLVPQVSQRNKIGNEDVSQCPRTELFSACFSVRVLQVADFL